MAGSVRVFLVCFSAVAFSPPVLFISKEMLDDQQKGKK